VILFFANLQISEIYQVLGNVLESNKMVEKYDTLTSELLEWIEQTIAILNDRTFANSLAG